MEWLETVVHTTTEGQELVSEALMRFGAVGTEIVDRADVPDPSKPGVYWELYDQKLLDDMPQDVLVKGWLALNEHTHDALSTLKTQLAAMKNADFGVPLYDHGRVVVANLPIAFVAPTAAAKKAATTIVFV